MNEFHYKLLFQHSRAVCVNSRDLNPQLLTELLGMSNSALDKYFSVLIHRRSVLSPSA